MARVAINKTLVKEEELIVKSGVKSNDCSLLTLKKMGKPNIVVMDFVTYKETLLLT